LARIIENPKKLILSKSKEILYQEGYNKFNMRNVARECRIALHDLQLLSHKEGASHRHDG
jgi:hypothetical protein